MVGCHVGGVDGSVALSSLCQSVLTRVGLQSPAPPPPQAYTGAMLHEVQPLSRLTDVVRYGGGVWGGGV